MQQVSYRNKPAGLSDSDSSDSENDSLGWKRSHPKFCPADEDSPKKAVFPTEPETVVLGNQAANACQTGPKRKVNTIWSSVLQEQSVTDILKDCGIKHKPITLQERSCESYDFRLKYSDPRESPDEGDMETDTKMEDGDTKANVPKITNRARLKISRQDIVIARKIIRVLNEKKHHLIERVVHVVGAEKALELLKRTEQIEDEGGMQTKDNTRRRTPGGVYLQLLKADNDVTKKQLRVIFQEEDCYSFALKKKLDRTYKTKAKKKRYKERKKKASQVNVKAEMKMEVVSVAANNGSALVPEPVMEDAPNSPSADDNPDDDYESLGSELEDGEIQE